MYRTIHGNKYLKTRKQRASPDLAERLAKHFGYAITEIQILYPERFSS